MEWDGLGVCCRYDEQQRMKTELKSARKCFIFGVSHGNLFMRSDVIVKRESSGDGIIERARASSRK